MVGTKSAYGSLQLSAKTSERATLSQDHLAITMSFVVDYLGGAILTNVQTGKGCMQGPLTELFRRNESHLPKERRLEITSSGVTMYFNAFSPYGK